MGEGGSFSRVGWEGGGHCSSVLCRTESFCRRPSFLSRKKKLELGTLLFPLNVNHASYQAKYYKYKEERTKSLYKLVKNSFLTYIPYC